MLPSQPSVARANAMRPRHPRQSNVDPLQPLPAFAGGVSAANEAAASNDRPPKRPAGKPKGPPRGPPNKGTSSPRAPLPQEQAALPQNLPLAVDRVALKRQLNEHLQVKAVLSSPDTNNYDYEGVVQRTKDLCDALKYQNTLQTAQKLFRKIVSEVPVEIMAAEASIVKELNLPARIVSEVLSLHPRARITRQAVDKLLLQLALNTCADKGLTHVLDYYGSKRFMKSTKHITSIMEKQHLPHGYTFEWHRPIITSKDATTYTDVLGKFPSSDLQANQVVLIQDVYMIPPEQLLDNLITAGVTVAYLATMIFTAETEAGLCFNEGPYYKNGEGNIVAAATSREPSWPPHPENDYWLRFDVYRTAAWELHRQIGDYYIFKIVIDPTFNFPIVEKIPPPIENVKIVMKKMPKAPTWRSYFEQIYHNLFRNSPLYFDNELYVFIDALEMYGNQMVNKSRQPYQMSQLTSLISSMLDRTDYIPLWQMLPPNHKYDKQRVLQDTVTYITWTSFPRDYTMTNHVSNIFGQALDVFKSLKSKFSVPPQSPIYKFLVIGLAIGLFKVLSNLPSFMHIFLLKYSKMNALQTGSTFSVLLIHVHQFLRNFYNRFSQPIAISDVVAAINVCGLAPAVEEKFKSSVGWCSVPIIATAETIFTCGMWPKETEWKFYAIGIFLYKLALHSLYKYVGPLGHSVGNALVIQASGMAPTNFFHWFAVPLSLIKVPDLVDFMWRGMLAASTLKTIYNGAENPLMKASLTWDAVARAIKNVTDRVLSMTTSRTINTVGSTLSHFGYLKHVIPERLKDWHNALQHHEQQTFVNEQFLSLTKEETFIPSAMIPPQNCSPFPLDAYDNKLKCVGQYVICTSPAVFERPGGIFQFYYALSQRNLSTAIYLQKCEELGCNPHNHLPCPIKFRWNELFKALKFDFMRRIRLVSQDDTVLADHWKLHRTKWVAHFNAAMQRMRAREAVAKRKEDFILPASSIFLKTDEVLVPKMTDGHLTVKGRLIKAVDPTIQADCCVAVDKAMKLLKMAWVEPYLFTNGWELSMAVGSGKNAQHLSEWFTEKLSWIQMRRKRAAFIIAGDDTFFIVMTENGRLFFGEIDFSKYDRTQGVHALMYEMKMLIIFGMTPETASKLLSAIMATANYEEKVLEFKAKISMPTQRATGGPDTTFGNTLNTGTSVLGFFLLHDEIDLTKLPEFQSTLGFESKYKDSDSFMGVTFLKGSWFPSRDRYLWLPLPSQAIKIGKLLTDPCVIFPSDGFSTAWRKAAYSLAQGVGKINGNYPILGDLLDLYRFWGIENSHKLKENEYRPEVFETEDLDELFVWDFLMSRYGIERYEVDELRKELLSLQLVGPPILLSSNPIWAKLWVDYS